MSKNVIVIMISIIIAGACISGSIIYAKNNQSDQVISKNSNQAKLIKQNTEQNNENQINNPNIIAASEKEIIQQQVDKPKSVQLSLAHIIEAIPQYNIVTKRVPYKYCENVNETIMVMGNKQDGSTGGTVGGVTGAIAGAVIGKQISGNDGGTAIGGVIGAVAGAFAGNQIEKNQTEQIPEQVNKRVCSTHYNKVEYKNVSGYKVVYEYNDQKNMVFTRKKPDRNYVPVNELI